MRDIFLNIVNITAYLPCTKLLRGNSNISDEIKENFDYPSILKPADGCNSHQVYLVENQTDLIAALEVLGERLLLVQEYIEGEHLSVTLLGEGKDVYPLSLNSQVFRGRKPFQYCGGTAGIKHPLQEQIFSQAIRAWQTAMISGLGGVDLVVGPSGIYVVEINPRPTAPVIALASCPNYNLGKRSSKQH
jgi:predicted ATP-grasp superfamily ATP-dependent carboligase